MKAVIINYITTPDLEIKVGVVFLTDQAITNRQSLEHANYESALKLPRSPSYLLELLW